MANDQVPVYSPTGAFGSIPSSELPAALGQGYKPKSSYVEAIHPITGATGLIPKEEWGDAAAQGYAPSPREVGFQESQRNIQQIGQQMAMGAGANERAATTQMRQQRQGLARDVVRSGADVIPPVTTALGASAGMAAFSPSIAGVPLGGTIGGGLGAGAGETARQGIVHGLLGEGPAPLSKEGLRQTATGAVIGAASELPGALLSGYGNLLLKRLATAQSADQVGDAVRAMRSYAPLSGVSQDSLLEGLESARSQASSEFGRILQSTPATNTVDLESSVLQSVRARAAAEDASFGRVARAKPGFIGPMPLTPGSTSKVTNLINDSISAAKLKAGISPNQAAVTAQELADFHNALRDEVYKEGAKSGIPGRAQEVLHDALTNSRRALSIIAPDAMKPLQDMTDISAAQSALKNYPLGNKVQAPAVWAATHPIATAVASPIITGSYVSQGPTSLQELRNLLTTGKVKK